MILLLSSRGERDVSFLIILRVGVGGGDHNFNSLNNHIVVKLATILTVYRRCFLKNVNIAYLSEYVFDLNQLCSLVIF